MAPQQKALEGCLPQSPRCTDYERNLACLGKPGGHRSRPCKLGQLSPVHMHDQSPLPFLSGCHVSSPCLTGQVKASPAHPAPCLPRQPHSSDVS